MSDSTHLRTIEALRCPETGQPLERIDDELRESINDAVDAGELVDQSGDTVERRLQDGLVREDGEVVYAIRDGIPNLLVDERIPLDSLSDRHA